MDELLDVLPDGWAGGIMATAGDPEQAPQAIVVVVSMGFAGKEIGADRARQLREWVPKAVAAAERAAGLFEKLTTDHPYPESEDDPWPGWIGTEWAYVLRVPWSAKLEEAMRECEQWLSTN